ncbi:hypothetical protein CV093_10235 [Oceanobacillus sp. 143]|nr:hypothetical protein CV093_10235 [Oceanobacillus sp. 143]
MKLVIDVKKAEVKADDLESEGLDSEEYMENRNLLEELSDNENIKFVYNNISVEINKDGETEIAISNSYLNKFSKSNSSQIRTIKLI